MKLYFSPGACSMSVHIALHEAGLAFDHVKVDLSKHQLEDGSDYYQISPRGYVPLLQLDDGSRHTEAASLLQYIGDKSPGQALIGAIGSSRRLAVVEWLTFISSELHKGFSPLWNPATPEAYKTMVLERLNKRLADVDAHLAKNDFLAGEFSVADPYAFTVINWANFLNVSLDAYPNVKAYLGRVAQRPAAQKALKEEGLA